MLWIQIVVGKYAQHQSTVREWNLLKRHLQQKAVRIWSYFRNHKRTTEQAVHYNSDHAYDYQTTDSPAEGAA